MKVKLSYEGDDILFYDTEFDPGFGHLMMIMGLLLDRISHEKPDEINIEIGFRNRQ